jgi:hypothetical protein
MITFYSVFFVKIFLILFSKNFIFFFLDFQIQDSFYCNNQQIKVFLLECYNYIIIIIKKLFLVAKF